MQFIGIHYDNNTKALLAINRTLIAVCELADPKVDFFPVIHLKNLKYILIHPSQIITLLTHMNTRHFIRTIHQAEPSVHDLYMDESTITHLCKLKN